MHLSLILLGIPAILCVVFFIIILRTRKENRLLARQLTETTVSLELAGKKFSELQDRQTELNAFHNNLQTAELTTRLQKPRLDAQKSVVPGPSSGKYSNIQSLADQGMSIEDIAAKLAVSTHEAQQLVNLAKIARRNSPGKVAA